MTDDRAERVRDRRKRTRERVSEESQPSKTGQTDKTEETEETRETDETSVKSKPSVLMYLDEDLKRDLDIRFDELNLERKREGKEPIEKNRDFYPKALRKGIAEISAEDFD